MEEEVIRGCLGPARRLLKVVMILYPYADPILYGSAALNLASANLSSSLCFVARSNLRRSLSMGKPYVLVTLVRWWNNREVSFLQAA